MARRPFTVTLAFVALGLLLSVPAAAQPLGTFRWQLQPFCNVLSVTVVQQGGQYQLDGTDDECGATQRSSVRGLAFLNPDGTVGFGLTIVPGDGRTVTIGATISPSTFSGSWQAAGGVHFGNFVFTPGAGTGGSPLPRISTGINDIVAGTGLIGGGGTGQVQLDVDFGVAQRRVTGACPAGQSIAAVNQNGTVTCQAVTGTAGGDITAVTAGSGLTGGGTTGDVSLGVIFGGSGLGTAVARADHTHEPNNTRNIAIGSSALPVNTGIDNLAIGANAMQANTTGGGNIAIGSFSLRLGTTTTSNIAIGQAALESTTGSRNTAVGYLAGRVNTSGADNVAFGAFALDANTSGGFNTAVGSNALGANTVGMENTALGRAALGTNTTGGLNTAVGARALQAATTASGNTAVGSGALESNVSGSGNVAVGENALNNNVASNNTAVGVSALFSTTSGTGNVAMGLDAMYNNTTGSDNTAVGHEALSYAESASFNTAVGSNALSAVSSGQHNTAVGRFALRFGGTGGSNTAVGSGALATSDGSSGNTAVGASALTDVTTGGGNLAIGLNAGSGLITGTGNIFIGSAAGGGAEAGTIRIGALQSSTYLAGVSGATSSSGVPVFVNAAGRLGTATSSARFKEQILPLGESQRARVQALRPVSFVYTPEFDDGSRQIQYGLIAEDVAETFPELLVRDADGQPQTVRYHLLAPLLLAEVQRLERERDTLEGRVRALETAVTTLLDRNRQR